MMHIQTGYIIEVALLTAALAMPQALSAAEPEPAGHANSAPDTAEPGDERLASTARTDASDEESARPCPPFCLNPMNIAEGVTTVAELEVMHFEQAARWNGNGVLIDTRSPREYHSGTIPGSVNIPFRVLQRPVDDPELTEILRSFGAEQRSVVLSVTRVLESMGVIDNEYRAGAWDFSNARDLLLWCGGPRCEQSPRAIQALIALGYPPEKLYYYRGGMRMWQSLGLETVKSGDVPGYASK